MGQPVPKNKKKMVKTPKKPRKKHKDYGTSKLEEKFAKEFLDRLGVHYIYQFKAESIGRFYDFYLDEANLIIEVDGDYWHSYGKVYENMNPTQKRNLRVDKQKDEWALSHGIPIIRIWEHDINKNPSMVIEMLKEKIGMYRKKFDKEKEKKKRH